MPGRFNPDAFALANFDNRSRAAEVTIRRVIPDGDNPRSPLVRRVRSFLVVASALACLVTTSLWVRSPRHTDVLAMVSPAGHLQVAASDRSGIVLFTSDVPAGREMAGHWTGESSWGWGDEVSDLRGTIFHPKRVREERLGFKYAAGALRWNAWSYVAVALPHWAIALPAAAPPALWARRRLRQWRRVRRGCCSGCGYDLRESPDRCPECGQTRAAAEDHGMHLRRGIVFTLTSTAVVIAAGGAGVAALRAFAPAPSPGDADKLVLRTYDVHDLANERYWPAGPPAVRVVEAAQDEWPQRSAGGSGGFGPYPRVIDYRWERLAGLTGGAATVPAADGPNQFLDGTTFGDAIAVAATRRVHAQFAQLLQALRAPGPGAAFATVVAGQTAPTSRPTQDAEAKLAEIVDEFRLDRVTPEAAFAALRERTRANIVVDWGSLASVGVERDAPGAITVHVWRLPLARILDVLLASTCPDNTDDLRYRVEGGVIRVATRDHLERSGASLRIYDVRQLLIDIRTSGRTLRAKLTGPPTTARAAPPVPPAEDEEQRAMEEIVNEVQDFITSSVMLESWRENGGAVGHLRTWAGRLLVYQTPEGHRDVERLLKVLVDEFGKDRVAPASNFDAAQSSQQHREGR